MQYDAIYTVPQLRAAVTGTTMWDHSVGPTFGLASVISLASVMHATIDTALVV